MAVVENLQIALMADELAEVARAQAVQYNNWHVRHRAPLAAAARSSPQRGTTWMAPTCGTSKIAQFPKLGCVWVQANLGDLCVRSGCTGTSEKQTATSTYIRCLTYSYTPGSGSGDWAAGPWSGCVRSAVPGRD